MATLSHDARYKARQIRELSRDLNTNHSVASSTGSHHGTVSDDTSTTFDPMEDGDCFMSTDLMNYHLNAQNSSQTQSQRLPELRDTAKKYNRWASRAQEQPAPTFSINQSALDQAFEDFDSGPVFSVDEFEIGRAAKTQQRSPHRAPLAEFSSNMDSQSHVITINDVDINYTPTSRPQQKALRTRSPRALSSLKKSARWLEENLRPKSPTPILPEVAQLPAYSRSPNSPVTISSPFTTTPMEYVAPPKARKVIPLPAHVANESDNSVLSELPSKVIKKATRTKQSPNTTTDTNRPTQTQQTNVITKSITPSQTQHSFALPPQVADVSKLVSGKSLLGESVSSAKKTKKIRSFSVDHASDKRDQKDFVEEHEEEDEIDIYQRAEILQQEVDRFKSLRQQDRMLISDLKKDRATLETEVEKLEKEKDMGYRKDSGVGSFNSIDSARCIHCSEVCQHKDQLELMTKERNEIQLRLDALESRFDQISQHNQQLIRSNEELANANENLAITDEDLHKHVDALSKARDELRLLLDSARSNIDQNNKSHQHNTKTNQQLTRKNQQLVGANEDLYNDVEALCKERDKFRLQLDNANSRLDQINNLYQHSTKNNQQLTRKNQELADANMAMSNAIEALPKERDELRLPLDNTDSLEHDQLHQQSTRTTQQLTRKNRELANTNKTLGSAIESLSKQRDELHLKLEQANHDGQRITNDQALMTPNEDLKRQVERLQKLIQQRDTVIQTLLNSTEPLCNKNDDVSDADADVTIETMKSIHSQRSGHSQRSHRSNKSKNSQRSSRYEGDADDTMETVQSQRSCHSRQSHLSHKSDYSHHSKTLQRSSRLEPTPNKGPTGILKNVGFQHQEIRRRSKEAEEDLTSAFIIPDIISPAKDDMRVHLALTPSARGVLDGLCEHNSRNCIVCARVATHDTEAGQKPCGKIHVPKPVPVSERMPVVEPYEDEPTLRPSVPPGVALATVIKAVRDEIEHLKIKQTDILNLYNKADTSLGMREKKKLHAQLTVVTAERDSKEDQLYALYDVLEGQKMAKQEVDESFDIDEELPWEGIEDSE